MQSRVELQRARRAALATVEPAAPAAINAPASVPVTPPQAAITPSPATRMVSRRGSSKVPAKLGAFGQVAGKLGAARQAGARTKLVSLAAIAATVAGTTVTATSTSLAQPLVFEEASPITAEISGIDIEMRLGAASRGAPAGRATSVADLTDLIGEYLEVPADENLLVAAEALSYAEMMLTHERRATPDMLDEIREAAEGVREALHVAAEFNAEGEIDPALVQSVLGESYVTPEDGELAEPFNLLSQVDAQLIAEELIAEQVEHATERLEMVLAEAELSVPAIAPRPLTALEAIEALVVEAQADGARLHAAYAYAFAGMSNGRIPASALQPLSWAPTHMLRPDAATQFERLNEAYRAQFGTDIGISSSYRTFAGQVQSRARHGRWAAPPGTSNHGWGVAVDLTGGINRFGTPQHRWMRENAPAFGWILPDWAQERGRLPEPWHWEFWGTPDPTTGEIPTPGVIQN